MKIHPIIMLLAAIIFTGSMAVAQTKDVGKSEKKESCCQTATNGTADKSKDCCKDSKNTVSKTDCMSKDGKKADGYADVVKTDCCSKDGKKTVPTGMTKDKDKK